MASPDITWGGFETGDFGETTNLTSGTVSVQTSHVRTGTYSLKSNPATTAVGWAQISTNGSAGASTGFSLATAWYGFYFLYITKPAANDEDICAPCASGAVVKIYVRLNSAGQLAVYDQGLTLLATGTTVLSSNTYYLIEVKCGTGGSSAAWEVKINGTVEIGSVAGNLGTGNNASILLGKVINHNGNSVEFYYDDFYISSTGYLGTNASAIAVPSADGTFTAWTIGAGSGSKWQQLTQIPQDGVTSYLQSTKVSGDAYTGVINAGAVVPGGSVVNGVKTVFFTDTGSGSIKYRLRSGSTNSDSAARTPPGSFGPPADQLYFLTDPNTGLAWAVGNMSALEAGAVEQSTTAFSFMTSAYIVVNYSPAPPALPIGPDSWMPEATSQAVPYAHWKIELVGY